VRKATTPISDPQKIYNDGVEVCIEKGIQIERYGKTLDEIKLTAPTGAWSAPGEAVRPGLYLAVAHSDKGAALRLVLTDSGPGRQTLHWADESGSAVGDHCLKRVYGPIEEDTTSN
jgi:hypothetical protein